MNHRRIGTVVLVFAISSANTAFAQDWLRYRGENGSGIYDGKKTTTKWGAKTNVKWRFKMPGRGFSSPIIVGDKVFITSYTGSPGQNLQRQLVCVNRATGKEVWTKTIKGALPEFRSLGRFAYHGYASSSPVSDGQRVYVHFGTTGLIAFDMSGKQLWQKNVGKETNAKFGSASSPIIYKNLVIVTAGAESESMRAFDKKTGKLAWKSEANTLSEGYGTPIIAKNSEGKEELLIYVPNEIWSFNPNTGKFLWFAGTGSSGNICSSLVVEKGIAYAVGGGGRGRPSYAAIRIGGKDDMTKKNRVWSNSGGAYVPSPLFYKGNLYWVTDRGVIHCVDGKTGRELGTKRLGADFYASPIIANGKMILVSRFDGAFVVEASPKLAAVSRNSLGDESDFSGTPAVANGQLFIRSDAYLYCIAAD